MLTLMHGTACGPDYILRSGKVYDLPRAIAKKLAGLQLIGAATSKTVKNGKEEKHEVEVSPAGPCATILSPDELPKYLKKGQKVLRMNPRPDPEDKLEIDVDDSDVGLIEDAE